MFKKCLPGPQGRGRAGQGRVSRAIKNKE